MPHEGSDLFGPRAWKLAQLEAQKAKLDAEIARLKASDDDEDERREREAEDHRRQHQAFLGQIGAFGYELGKKIAKLF